MKNALKVGKYELITKNGEKQRLTIGYDKYPENPREWDNVAEFVSKYDDSFFDVTVSDFDELKEYIEKSGECVYKPFYVYEHSGIAVHVCGNFDESTAGVVIVTKEKALRELSCTAENWQEVALQCIDDELSILNQYLEGDVYFYLLERVETCKFCGAEHSTQLDSCYGFFGIESILEYLPDEWRAVFDTTV